MSVDGSRWTPGRQILEVPHGMAAGHAFQHVIQIHEGPNALALRTITNKWREEIRRNLLTLAALLSSASVFGVATPASAVTYPVCLAGGEAATLQCDYASLEQCQAAASGIGYCAMNPAYSFNAYAYSGTRKRVR